LYCIKYVILKKLQEADKPYYFHGYFGGRLSAWNRFEFCFEAVFLFLNIVKIPFQKNKIIFAPE